MRAIGRVWGLEVQSVGARVADPKRRIGRNIWEGPLLWRWCFLRVLCTFAVVRPLGEEEGVWVKGRAEQRTALFGAGGNQRKQRTATAHKRGLRLAGWQARRALHFSVQRFLPLLALCTTIIGRTRKQSITKGREGKGRDGLGWAGLG